MPYFPKRFRQAIALITLEICVFAVGVAAWIITMPPYHKWVAMVTLLLMLGIALLVLLYCVSMIGELLIMVGRHVEEKIRSDRRQQP